VAAIVRVGFVNHQIAVAVERPGLPGDVSRLRHPRGLVAVELSTASSEEMMWPTLSKAYVDVLTVLPPVERVAEVISPQVPTWYSSKSIVGPVNA